MQSELITPDATKLPANGTGEQAPQALVHTPMELLQISVNRGDDIAKLEKLMDLQERWEKNEARKAFEAAMAAFKAEPIVITKDRENKQYGSSYTSVGNLVGTVTPFLSKHGLSANWELDRGQNEIRITCALTHKQGHSKSVSITLPPDKSGSKNPLQEVKSAVTYGRIITFEAVCGLASSDEANLDDDGNAAGKDTSWLDEWLTAIRDSSSAEEVRGHFSKAYSIASDERNERAKSILVKAKDEKLKQFKPANSYRGGSAR